MGSLKFLFKDVRLFERRKREVPVPADRRRPKNVKEADEHFREALQKLNEATKPLKREVANDIQTVVVFKTFSEICRFRGSDALSVRLCRNSRHQDAANSALAKCDEERCPLLIEALKGAA